MNKEQIERKADQDALNGIGCPFKNYTVAEGRALNKYKPKGITNPWGIENVKIPRGAVTLVAGSTSHGKTTALISLCHHIHKETKGKILYYSVEEQPSDIASRIVASKSMLTHGIKDDAICSSDPSIIATLEVGEIIRNDNPAELNKINCLNIDYIDIVDCSCFYERKAEQRRRETYVNISESIISNLNADTNKNIQGVIIDCLQDTTRNSDISQARDIITEQAMECITLAVHESRPDIILIFGAQLNREHEKQIKWNDTEIETVREKTEPHTYYLRDGGSEQGASLILGLNYLHQHSKSIPNNIIDIHVLKNRHGIQQEPTTCTIYPAHSLICSNKPIEPEGKAQKKPRKRKERKTIYFN